MNPFLNKFVGLFMFMRLCISCCYISHPLHVYCLYVSVHVSLPFVCVLLIRVQVSLPMYMSCWSVCVFSSVNLVGMSIFMCVFICMCLVGLCVQVSLPLLVCMRSCMCLFGLYVFMCLFHCMSCSFV